VIRLAQRIRAESGERGAVLVMVVLWLPVLLVFFMFVADVGNWFVHRRHLQMQADAGALAGGGNFRIPCLDTPVESDTRWYAGDPSVSSTINNQIPPTDPANIHVLINSTSYWDEGGTDFSDGGSPCTTKFVDVKITEANLPWFMRLAFVPAIRAHARVSILQKTSQQGSLPIAVPDVRPRDAAAFVIDEATQTVLASAKLTNEGPATLNGRSLTKWTGDLPSFSFTAPATSAGKTLGVVIALSGSTTWSLSGGLGAVCTQALVVCYQNVGSATSPVLDGLVFLRGYAPSGGTGTLTTPIIRDVSLSTAGGTCSDTSAPSFLLTGCTVSVRAQIDWGTGASPPPNTVVKIPGFSCPGNGNNQGCDLSFNSGTGYWEATASLPAFQGSAGQQSISLKWRIGTGGNFTTVTGLQRVFGANTTDSGPIEFAQVIADGAIGATSLASGTHSISVAIGVKGNLENDSHFSDPTTVLRVAGPAGSQNNAIDCDAGRTLRDEIATGCQTAFQLNTGETCPNATVPLNCAEIQTGDSVGQLRQGMDARFASCPPNNWTNPGDPTQFPNILPGDPRAIPLILVPFGSFSGSGNDWIPVTDFGTFYVTGWDYVGQEPCADNEDFPGPGSPQGDIWGHFIKYVDSINTGGTGDVCDFDPSSFGTCVAVLTQ
jgi:hypothetical protein